MGIAGFIEKPGVFRDGHLAPAKPAVIHNSRLREGKAPAFRTAGADVAPGDPDKTVFGPGRSPPRSGKTTRGQNRQQNG